MPLIDKQIKKLNRNIGARDFVSYLNNSGALKTEEMLSVYKVLEEMLKEDKWKI